ncbi:MAG: CcmD family protein [Thermodesulfobacteriota bacterium]
MEYLFWSNIIIWVSITTYVIYLKVRSDSLNKEIDSFKNRG